MKLVNNLDLNQFELQNGRIQNLAAAPSSPVVGQVYFDTVIGAVRAWNGTAWISLDASKLSALIPISALTIDPRDRNTHTGTQSASTIWDFNTYVRNNSLTQMAAPTGAVGWNYQRITALADPMANNDAANKQYVDSAAQSAAAGIDAKASVRVVATSNITLSGLQTIDGVSLVAGDRVLVTGQATGSQNGFYNAASGAWTRTVDADQNSEVTPGAFAFVEEGTTYGKTQWRLNTTGPIALGTTNLLFQQFGAVQNYTAGNGLDLTGNSFSVKTPASSGLVVDAAGVKVDTTLVTRKAAATVGDGSSTSFAIAHNFGTQDVSVTVREISTNVSVYPDVVATNANNVTVTFGSAPASNSYRVLVVG